MSFSCQKFVKQNTFEDGPRWLIANEILKEISQQAIINYSTRCDVSALISQGGKSILNPTHRIARDVSYFSTFWQCVGGIIWMKDWRVTGNRFFREVWTLVSDCKECRLFFSCVSAKSMKSKQVENIAADCKRWNRIHLFNLKARK